MCSFTLPFGCEPGANLKRNTSPGGGGGAGGGGGGGGGLCAQPATRNASNKRSLMTRNVPVAPSVVNLIASC
jgi:hypothetical protein